MNARKNGTNEDFPGYVALRVLSRSGHPPSVEIILSQMFKKTADFEKVIDKLINLNIEKMALTKKKIAEKDNEGRDQDGQS